ncbi:MAG: hypothetical protein ACREIC_33490, partial [Limisphaerales bacterium]
MGLAVLWWRHSGGATYSLRELLPGPRGLKIFGIVLLCWYLFWGFAIKPKSIPPVWPGQLTVWVIYLALVLIFYGCLLRARQGQNDHLGGPGVVFEWRGFFRCVGVGTAVTVAARWVLHDFMAVQIAAFFTLYVIAGLCLLVGSARYAFRGLTPIRLFRFSTRC